MVCCSGGATEGEGGTVMCEQVVLVAKTCPICGKEEQHPIPQDGYLKWKSGVLIQRALHDLNECIREFLISGMCADCREEIDRISLAMENDTYDCDIEEGSK